MTTRAGALQQLDEAAAPYALKVARTSASLLPELVLIRVQLDGLAVVRLQYAEADRGPPVLRTLIHDDLPRAEQMEVERHVEERLAPVIRQVFSFALWMSLADP